MAKNKSANLLPQLTETEQDLLSHIADGYRLQTDSLGSNPVLRNLKNNEEIRRLSANRNTIKALEQRGLISPGKRPRPAHYRVVVEKESKMASNQTSRQLRSIRNLRSSGKFFLIQMLGAEHPINVIVRDPTHALKV